MALVAGGGAASQPLPAALLHQLIPPTRGRRVSAPYSSDDERTPLIPTGTPDPSSGDERASLISTGTPDPSSSSDKAPTSSFSAATGAKRWRPFRTIGDVFDTWRKQGHEELHADVDIEMAVGGIRIPALSSDGKRRPLTPTGTPDPSASASNSAPVRRATGRAAESMVDAGTSSSASVVGQGVTTDWMKRFKGLLVAFVFFVLPIVLFFFPRYDKNQNQHVLLNLMDNSKIDFEKVAVLVFFVIVLTAGVLGVLLSHIAQGPKVTRAVGAFTLWIILSILGFMDYILVKTMPDNLTTKLIFLSHFILTATVICFLWFRYVWPSGCCQGGTTQD